MSVCVYFSGKHGLTVFKVTDKQTIPNYNKSQYYRNRLLHMDKFLNIEKINSRLRTTVYVLRISFKVNTQPPTVFTY